MYYWYAVGACSLTYELVVALLRDPSVGVRVHIIISTVIDLMPQTYFAICTHLKEYYTGCCFSLKIISAVVHFDYALTY